MLDHRIKLRHLRCFLETARLGSLSAAASALNVSQPAASKTIRELEAIVGQDLFDRSARRLILSPAGRIFQRHTGAAMIELVRAQDLIKGAPRENTRLSVGVLPTAATTLMPKAALQFREVFPDCLLRVSTGPNWLLMSQLREGTLDLVVGRMASAKVMEQLTFHQLYSESILAIVRPDHPLRVRADPEATLSDFPLVLPPSGAVISPLVRAYLSKLGISPHGASVETVSLAFGRAIVQSSDAIWFISKGVVADELAQGTLSSLEIDEDLQGGPVGVSMRETGTLTPEQKGLVDAIQAAATAIKP